MTTLEDAISEFGKQTKAKLSNPAASGAPEDQLRAPLESLLKTLAEICGQPAGAMALVGESSLSEIKTRPDYAVTVNNALIGFIEVKAPGKGADPRKFKDAHDADQWRRLKSLPNLIYTDGNAFSVWRNGELLDSVVNLDGDVESAGASLKAPATLVTLFSDFLNWAPIAPKTPKQLAETSAHLCRLLRDEVTEHLKQDFKPLTSLAEDWKDLLFPEATPEQFADGYAQAVTFGLLVARARNIELSKGIYQAAHDLGTGTLIGAALRLLTDSKETQEALETSLGTLTRVLDVVDWPTLSKGEPEAWLYFYEDFLGVYDKALRKATGSYYTPPEVVSAMVRLVDEALASPSYFGRTGGLASNDVTVADPAVGTGTFLLGVLRRIADTVEADQGAGAVAGEINAAIDRLYGFELQFGPFAVAQLRILAEIQDLLDDETATAPGLHLYLTDTLGNPFVEEERFPSMLQPIAKSRTQANAVKREQPITVVIGNPPYKEKAKGRGGWVEEGSKGRPAPLDYWQPPSSWGVSAHAKHLRNLYIYFWRWATWKVFGTDVNETSGLEDADREGIISYITVAGFLNGPGFERMRASLRETSSEIWVIDCSPEGHQPEVPTRVFQGVQQPVCIVLALKKLGVDKTKPAKVRFHRLPAGSRQDKFDALAKLTLGGSVWRDCPDEWRAPFLPEGEGAWPTYPALDEFFLYNGSGVMPGRTWVIAPDKQTLETRWTKLIAETAPDKKECLFHPHLVDGVPSDKHIRKPSRVGLGSHPQRPIPIIDDNGPCPTLLPYGYRTLDRQWIITDNRVLNRPNPSLWAQHSDQQVYITALARSSPSSGPAVSITGNIPDLDHYKGSFGGRVFPLWGNSASTEGNVTPRLVDFLSAELSVMISPSHVVSYLAGVLAHSGFTRRFRDDFLTPGVRVPLSADSALFLEAAEIGAEVIWLHTYGERFADPAKGRAAGPPRLPKSEQPTIPKEGQIPSDAASMPDTLGFDETNNRLTVGSGYVENVTKAMWEYEVSGKNTLTQWFSSRRRDRSRPIIGDRRPPSPLDKIQPDGWLPEYTKDLLNLLNVLGLLVKLEPKQADLLDRICAGPLFSKEVLQKAGALDKPIKSGKGKKAKSKSADQGQLI